MNYIPDDMLIEIYKDAIHYQIDDDFIQLIKKELIKRDLFPLIEQSSDRV